MIHQTTPATGSLRQTDAFCASGPTRRDGNATFGGLVEQAPHHDCDAPPTHHPYG